jgi:hypothetical protein
MCPNLGYVLQLEVKHGLRERLTKEEEKLHAWDFVVDQWEKYEVGEGGMLSTRPLLSV